MNGEIGHALLTISLLILVSAVLSAAGTSLTAASRARLAELEKKEPGRARKALLLLESPERLVGALLLGSNLANITASAIAAAAVMRFFGNAGLVIVAALMTVLILVFAEVVPRTIAITYPERTSMAVAPVVRVVVAVFGPLVLAVEAAVRSALKLFGAGIDDNLQVLTAHEELRGAIDLHHKDETLVKEDRDRLGGILDLKDLEVADIMIHRTKMKSLDLSMDPQQLVKAVLESPHTRMPVWRDKPDNIVGVLHAKTLFTALQAAGGDPAKLDMEKVMAPAWFVPDTRPLEDQLNAFLRRKSHFALVVDEYGEVQGLVTLEDILEEIVGDIKDEFDAVSSVVRKTRDGALVIDGTVPIRDLNRSLDWRLPDDEATTLAGLVIHEARMIPDAGQVFSFHGFKFEVLKKRRQQITQIKVSRIEPSTQEGEEG
jgi:Mg2+/Co2+ transporter CorB